jgi:hypothetical protein
MIGADPIDASTYFANSSTGRVDFLGGVAFAAVASLATPMLTLLLARWIDPERAAGLALIALTLAFVGASAPSRRDGLRGGISILPGIVLAWSGARVLDIDLIAVTVLACATSLAWLRSRRFHRMPGWRGVASELALQVGGLGLGGWLAACFAPSSLLGMAAGIWGYLLVQSFFALLPGTPVRGQADARAGAFGHACQRLERLLEA